jgi:hypothetical protein
MVSASKIHLDPVAVLLLIASCGYEDMHFRRLPEDEDKEEYYGGSWFFNFTRAREV